MQSLCDCQGLEQGRERDDTNTPVPAAQPKAGTLTEAKGKSKRELKAPQPRGWQEGEDGLRCAMFWENV